MRVVNFLRAQGPPYPQSGIWILGPLCFYLLYQNQTFLQFFIYWFMCMRYLPTEARSLWYIRTPRIIHIIKFCEILAVSADVTLGMWHLLIMKVIYHCLWDCPESLGSWKLQHINKNVTYLQSLCTAFSGLCVPILFGSISTWGWQQDRTGLVQKHPLRTEEDSVRTPESALRCLIQIQIEIGQIFWNAIGLSG